VTDATGETVTIEEEPERVVAIAPSAAQTTWAVGAEDKIVGMPVGYTTAYLNGSQDRTNVYTSDFTVITEEVVGLEPDLVLAANINDNDTVQNLRDSGLTVVKFEQALSIDGVAAKTRLTGRLLGSCEQAAQVNERMNATVEEVRSAAESRERQSVYYAMGGGWTAGPNTFIGDVIATAGGDNIASAAEIQTYGQISEEVVVAENPDWIVTTSERNIPYSAALNSTTAVQEGQIVVVNGNYLSQPGPRITDPLTKINDAFEAATDSSETTTTTVDEETTTSSEETGTETTASAGTTTEDTESDDTGSGFGPGVGAVGAIVAIVAAVLVGRRR
jgi:iron complex transport system substrate-binding protein